jgi:hypothetical protein
MPQVRWDKIISAADPGSMCWMLLSMIGTPSQMRSYSSLCIVARSGSQDLDVINGEVPGGDRDVRSPYRGAVEVFSPGLQPRVCSLGCHAPAGRNFRVVFRPSGPRGRLEGNPGMNPGAKTMTTPWLEKDEHKEIFS